jgi:ketosteroid isomerase-like protein
MTEIIAALRRAYEAFNHGDIPGCLEALDPDIEWIEPAEFVGGGTYYGHAGVTQYLTQSRQAWAAIHSEPEEFIQAGDKIVVFVHAITRAKDSDQERDARIADVYTIRDGKAIRMQAFADRDEALRFVETNPDE